MSHNVVSRTRNVHAMEDVIAKIVDMKAEVNAEIDRLVDRRRRQWQYDRKKLTRRGGTVHIGRFQIVFRNIFHGGINDQHMVAHALPAFRQYHRR